jgi:hypothetical protein
MKIQVRKRFHFQATPSLTEVICPGIYSVPQDIPKELADKILKWGKASLVMDEKKAPENKLGGAAESKTGLARKAGRGGRTRAKP